MLRFAANSLHEGAKFKIITQLVPLFIGLSNRSDIGVAAISPRATTEPASLLTRGVPASLAPGTPVELVVVESVRRARGRSGVSA